VGLPPKEREGAAFELVVKQGPRERLPCYWLEKLKNGRGTNGDQFSATA